MRIDRVLALEPRRDPPPGLCQKCGHPLSAHHPYHAHLTPRLEIRFAPDRPGRRRRDPV